MFYVITVNRPGYLPESDPYVVADERPPVQVLEALYHHALRYTDAAMDADGVEIEAWEAVLDEITNDIEAAASFDPEAGFVYGLPDGYNIAATARSRDELIELGYTPGEDF